MQDTHRKAAEHHELAAHAHRTAAEHHEKGDGEAGAFCHDVSRAFFTEHADILKREVIVPIAERSGILSFRGGNRIGEQVKEQGRRT